MSAKKGQLNRSDLLEAKLLLDNNSGDYIARQLGLKKIEWIPAQDDDQTENEQQEQSANLPKPSLPALKPSDRPATQFWYLHSRQPNNKTQKKTQPITGQTLDWKNRPQHAPEFQPLLTKKQLLAKLQPYLYQIHASHKVDFDSIVHTISRGEYLANIPKKPLKTPQMPLHIIDDRSRHLTCYAQDHYFVSETLLQHYTQANISLSVLADNQAQPQQISTTGLADWQLAAHSTVLILSDLGRLHSYPQRGASRWLAISRVLQRKQCRIIVLLPYATAAVDHRFKAHLQLLSWAHKDCADELAQPARQGAIDKLFTALSPCVRIEPGLLRAMRLAMQQCGQAWQLPVAIEAYCWQHEAIQEPHRVAASWAVDKRKAYLHAFEALTDTEKQTALNTIRLWRGELSEKIWYEEIISLDPQSQQLQCIQADVQQAQDYFVQLSQDLQQDDFLADNKNTRSWFKRLYHRLPTECLQASRNLQSISERVFQGDKDFKRQWLNPQNLPQSEQPIQQAVVYQQGLQLYLKTYTPFDLSQQGYSPLALIKLRRDYVQVMSKEQVLGELSLNQPQGIQVSTRNQLTLISDEETLKIRTLSYTNELEMGRDRYGLYADIEIFGITQRFRYIEPGAFMMGSPEDEPERFDDEDYHQVTLTQGYWLADSACTQALWLAVMGENPADFSEDLQNPVENVNWLDIQTFLQRINKQSSGYQLQLPSEAQWEYACRAGTTTPFSFGDNISPKQVNYNGKKPYAGAEKGEYREKTVAVKSLPANPWGLFEMHGNVWEWCRDEYLSDLGTEAELDPVFDSTDKGVSRVLRGGSWIRLGGNCRSAMRDDRLADGRFRSFGFRFSLGHELPPAEMSRSDKNRPDSDQAEPVPARRGAVQGQDLPGRGAIDIIKNLFSLSRNKQTTKK